MEPVQSLVYYAAVAKATGKNNVILADYIGVGEHDFAQMAAKCLVCIPPLHNRFSYTTSHRMFICLIEGLFIYCAIMDEALSKAKAYMFLEHVRDACKVLLQQRDVHPDALTAHYIHSEMSPFFTHLAASLVGIPQREKVRMKEQEELLQAQKDADNDFEINSPSAVAPLKMEMSDEDFDLQTEHKPSSATTRSPHMPLIGKGKRGKKKSREYDKGPSMGSPIDNSSEALNKGKNLEILIDDCSPPVHNHAHKSGWRAAAKEQWCCKVRVILMLDLVVCVLLLTLWLAVCSGVDCMKKNS